MEVIPPLREELEVTRRPDGHVDVRDPRLLNVFTLDSSYYEIAVLFDGERTSREVAEAMVELEGEPHDESDIATVARELEELLLLDTPAALEAEPSIENTAPHSILEGVRRRLRVLPDLPPASGWNCQACGACCHGLVVELTEEEEARIDASLYRDIIGDEDYATEAFIDPEEPTKRVLRQRSDDDNACIFLSEDGLCQIHARQGMTHKPDACQIFPYMVIHVPGGRPRVGMRTNCQSMHETWKTGTTADEAVPEIKRLLKTHDSLSIPKKIQVFGSEKTPEQVVRWFGRVMKRFTADGVTRASLREVDDKILKGRVAKSRRSYGKRMLAAIDAERAGPVPVQEGGIEHHLRVLQEPLAPLEAMRRGRKPSKTPEEVARFLARQTGLVLHGFGPLNLPDAGIGLVGLLLTLEACLHAVGPEGDLRTANLAFLGFTSPLLENTAHAWPILFAVDADYTEELRTHYMDVHLN